MTEGFSFFAAIALATFAAAAYGSPTAASAIVQTRMKSRRSTVIFTAASDFSKPRSLDVMPTSSVWNSSGAGTSAAAGDCSGIRSCCNEDPPEPPVGHPAYSSICRQGRARGERPRD